MTAGVWQIPTHGMPRPTWLALRLEGLGGSDAAAACGLSPWKSVYGLWLEKTEATEPTEDEDRHLQWGRLIEEPILLAAREETGLAIQPHRFMVFNRSYPWAYYDTDGVLGEDGIFEAKSANGKSDEWGQPGTDEIPMPYLLQVQHGMAVMGKAFAILAVSRWGRWPDIYRVERHESLIAGLMRKEAAFWDRVERNQEPPMDWEHPQATAEIQAAYPGTDGTTVDLPAEAARWHETVAEANAEIAAAEAVKARFLAKIRKTMGNAAVGMLPDGTAYTRKQNANGKIILRHVKRP
ncbi:phage-type endonuclease [Solidesulfovibrio carbinoliphilus subsp. oakridgensis]|uniref:Phage-type endonuclease n=1 Tax=Solidesulfovibrio carbinoliphilus subsp. oakridgensis TaxID=694327 RepID=G7Q5K2_9BACT|nr:YqaJ viral recombinase family protein [Solidesulfovibrio carbinoliphilus]EHJ49561.1 phage-type endonuclease [Solidesulfovibrio carbinoliphilus subsp. oakridgensis]